MTHRSFTIEAAIACRACPDGVARARDELRGRLGVDNVDTVPITIGDVATWELYDAQWCLMLLTDRRDRVRAVIDAVERASACAEAYPGVRQCIDAVKRWLAGDDSADLRAARYAAEEETAVAARSARHAAMAAARLAEAAKTTDAEWAAKCAGWAAMWSAKALAWGATAAERKAETEHQRQTLIRLFPPLVMTAGGQS